jgi:hypothetical protein
MGIFSLNSWMAIIIKNMLAGTVLVNSTSTGGDSRTNTLHPILLSAIPYLCAAVGMCWVAHSSHHYREKDFHIGIPYLVGGICLAIFEPLYRRSFAAGFSVIVIALALAYCCDSVMFARVAGETRGTVRYKTLPHLQSSCRLGSSLQAHACVRYQ